MVVAWRFSFLSWQLAKLLVKTPYATMANVVAGREIIPELLQGKANPASLASALAPLIRGGEERERALSDLKSVAKSLGGPGASAKVVGVISRVLGEDMPQMEALQAAAPQADASQADALKAETSELPCRGSSKKDSFDVGASQSEPPQGDNA